MTKPVSYWILGFIVFGTFQLIQLGGIPEEFGQAVSDISFIMTLWIMPIWLWFFYEYQNERIVRSKWLLLLWAEPIIIITLYLFDIYVGSNDTFEPGQILTSHQRLGGVFIFHSIYIRFYNCFYSVVYFSK